MLSVPDSVYGHKTSMVCWAKDDGDLEFCPPQFTECKPDTSSMINSVELSLSHPRWGSVLEPLSELLTQHPALVPALERLEEPHLLLQHRMGTGCSTPICSAF
jgi:hypothetical protein